MKGRVLVVIGTRPEAIKLAPVVAALRRQDIEPAVCLSGQHRELIDLGGLGIHPTHEMRVRAGSLAERAAEALAGVARLLVAEHFDAVLVQGDTTTAFAAAVAAFYAHVPIGHVEAGLRTGNLGAPWPEEGHRAAIDRLSTWLFAPTERARDALLAEGSESSRVWLVGNTGIDALLLVDVRAEPAVGRRVLVTVHRRENLGEPLATVCRALRRVAARWPDVRIIFPVHPNPEVSGPVFESLSSVAGIDLVPPMDHASMIRAVADCRFIVTDSGGLQEEAPYLGKPVLVLRETTDRPEGVAAGTARLVGTSDSRILAGFAELLDDPAIYSAMSTTHRPYGDGHAADRIAEVLAMQLTRAARFVK